MDLVTSSHCEGLTYARGLAHTRLGARQCSRTRSCSRRQARTAKNRIYMMFYCIRGAMIVAFASLACVTQTTAQTASSPSPSRMSTPSPLGSPAPSASASPVSSASPTASPAPFKLLTVSGFGDARLTSVGLTRINELINRSVGRYLKTEAISTEKLDEFFAHLQRVKSGSSGTEKWRRGWSHAT